MTRTERAEERVRGLLNGTHPPVPLYLAERAVALGRRRQRTRRLAWVAVWLLAVAALTGLAVWVGMTDAFMQSPSTTTPDFGGL